MLCKGFPTLLRYPISSIRLAAYELLLASKVAGLFETTGMARQIAIGELQQRLQRIKIRRTVSNQHRHDAQADLALENLI